jgi:hypothetical protein
MVVLAFLQALTAQQQQGLVAGAEALTMRLVAQFPVQAVQVVAVLAQPMYFRRVKQVLQILAVAVAVELRHHPQVLREAMAVQVLSFFAT